MIWGERMKGFCENCRDTVDYQVKTIDKGKEIKGKTIEYVVKIAYCEACKSEIFVSDIRDFNLKALDLPLEKKKT